MKNVKYALALALLPLAAHADVAAEITTAKTDILAVVAAAGAALVAIAVAGVAWKVGGRWISRLGSHA